MPDFDTREKRFEQDIEASLLTHGGYQKGNPAAFDRTQLLLGGGTDAICEQAYQEAAVHMPQVVAELRALNPDAQIILLGYTNPVPLLPEWTQLFRRLNALSKSLAAQNENVTYVPIPFAMTATDAHPTVSGHKYIANRILRAIKK